jgi:adenosylmethionine-8-amino-7-oxononanoate aminotransferase
MPDVLALAKGLTGGYLPLAATLTTEEIFQSFSGGSERTFYHGHSYTANPLGCAAALANLELLHQPKNQIQYDSLVQHLQSLSARFWAHPNVGDVRQEGAILAIELVADRTTRAPLLAANRTGHKVCQVAREFGLLTRPIGDVLVLMPPYCTTDNELEKMVDALLLALNKVIPK